MRISSATTKGQGLHEMKPLAGAFIQFACAANQTVKDTMKTDRNGLFTKHLLKHVNRENTDISDIFQGIVDDVYRESNHQQRPSSMTGLSQHQQVYLNEVIVPPKGKSHKRHIKCSILCSLELTERLPIKHT
jgi:hypothetical protein